MSRQSMRQIHLLRMAYVNLHGVVRRPASGQLPDERLRSPTFACIIVQERISVKHAKCGQT